MPVFNKRDRDNKGAGKIRLDENEAVQEKSFPGKKVLIGGAIAIAAGGLLTVFLMASGGDENEPKVTGNDNDKNTVAISPAGTNPVTSPVKNEPAIVVQSVSERVQEKAGTIFNHNGCLYEAFVNASGHEVREGSDFNYFTCLYDEGGIGVLLTEGKWAGTRVNFLPREGKEGRVSVEIVGKPEIGADNRTTEYHRLPRDERLTYSASMAHPDIKGDGVSIPNGAERFVKTVYQGGQSANAFIITGDPQGGVFEVEIPNGDVYQVNLNTGDFYADSLFLNCPAYRYGQEGNCPRDNFQPVKGALPKLDKLTR